MNNEDIKTIEQLIDKCKNCTLQECINCEINYNQVHAIEKLLKENEKQRENLKIATAMLTKGTYPSENEEDNDFEKQFVPVAEMNKRISEIINAKIGVDLSNENYISDEKEKEVVEAYRNIKKITGSDSWIVCNPETMWSEYFVPVAKIEEKIEELEKEYNEILADYGNIDTDVIINIPNENVRKYLEKLADKIITLQELLKVK